jgi:hypothetical protein
MANSCSGLARPVQTTTRTQRGLGRISLVGLGAQLQNLDVDLMSWVAGSRAASLLAAPSRVTTPLTLLAASAAELLVVQARHQPTVAARTSVRRVAVIVFALTTLESRRF